MLLIPALDLRGGRCVRLDRGDFACETIYAFGPHELFARYQALGALWLHVVDLDGARDGVPVNLPLIANLAGRRSLRLQVGGGVRTAAIVEALMRAGVLRIVIGSAAVERPGEVRRWLECFGSERFCLAFDIRANERGEPVVQTQGWTRNSAVNLWEALEAFPSGLIQHALCTDVERDGTLLGPNLTLYAEAVKRFPALSWQASGGIRNAADLNALARLGVAAAVTGKALLERRIPDQEIRPFLLDASSPASTSVPARS